MAIAVRFWFVKAYDKPFENVLDIIREALNDAKSKEYALKAFEVNGEAGDNNIHQELTRGTAGKLRGIDLGIDFATLAPPAAPRPEIASIIHFRDYISPAKPLENFLPQESLMEFTAQLSHKVGSIMLMNAGIEKADGYIIFENGRISDYGFCYSDEFVLRYHAGQYALDVYNIGEGAKYGGTIGMDRLSEAVEKANLNPCTINTHEEEMVLEFWKVSREGFNNFYGTKLNSLGTSESNFATLHQVGGSGIGHYEIYPDGVSYAYPESQSQPEQKKPWWKVW